MKAVFKQSVRNMRFYIFAGCSLLVFVLALLDCIEHPQSIAFLMVGFLLWFPLLMTFKRSYTITDEDVIKGNGVVPIRNIRKLVQQPDSVVAYYLQENSDKMCVKPYFVAEKELFIEKLKEINPDIQVF